jgi:NADPH-dependent 2,4-dienoyl-CoA reductase/sulfur reductase-like enzyme
VSSDDVDVVVIGGGQAGLAAGYYLRRAGHRFVILDDQPSPGRRLAAHLGVADPVLSGAVFITAGMADA